MRVLHVNDCAGVATNLVRGLRELGVQAELFQPTIGTYRAHKTVMLALPFIRTLEAIRLRQFVEKRAFDIVHIHYARFAYMALITGLPYVLHVHGGDLHVDLNRPGFRELTRLAIHKAVQVYFATPDLERILINIRKDVAFLPNPIDLNRFDSSVRDHRPDRPRILSISKLDKRKGVGQILATVEKILHAYPEIEVAIFNFGDDSEQARSFFHRYQSDSRLVPLSRIPHEEIPSLINSATIVLGQQSPDIGALGVSELEAMACAKPVICNFAYPEIYSSPPPVLISRSPDEACEHMLRLLNDAEYRRHVGQESRSWVSENHELGSVAQTLMNDYIKVIWKADRNAVC